MEIPMTILKELKVALSNPKFMHVMLSWGQAWGYFFGVLLLILGKWAMKDGKLLKVAFITLIVSGSLAYAIEHNSYYAKPEQLTSSSPADRERHESLRKSSAIFHYIFVAICLMNIVGKFEGDKEKWPFTLLLLGAIYLLGATFWHQFKECQLVYRGI
jgi:Na+/melibiose symporter-like transporter